MPRTARASVAETWYHVLNRGNRRETVFDKPADYDAFIETLVDAQARLSLVGNGQASQAGFVMTRCCGGAPFPSVMIGGWNE